MKRSPELLIPKRSPAKPAKLPAPELPAMAASIPSPELDWSSGGIRRVTDWYFTGMRNATATLASRPTAANLQSRLRFSQNNRRCGSRLGVLRTDLRRSDSGESLSGGSSTVSRPLTLIAEFDLLSFNVCLI